MKMKILYIILGVIVVAVLKMFVGNVKTPSNLGVNNGKLAPLPKSPNAVSSQTDKQDFYVEPFPFKENAMKTKSAISEAINSYGGGQIVVDEPIYERYLFTTAGMHYHDDVEFYLDEKAKVVHFRSASRVGYSDMGLNKERYNEIYEYYINH